MFLRVLDAFDEDTKHAQQYSAIAAPWAAAISVAFARSKGAGAGKGGLQAADTRVGIELRLPGKSLADADNGPRMSPFEGNRCTRLRRLLALAVHGSEAARQGLYLRHADVLLSGMGKGPGGIASNFSGWDPSNGPSAASDVRLEQKRREMVLADLTLVASRYVEGTIREFYPHKEIARVPYGVDVEFWTPEPTNKPAGPLRFIYAGQVSLRKGVPLLIEAWSKAELRDAELALVGSWALADSKRRALPPGITWFPPCSWQALRERYRESDVFVFPSFSDGFGLVLLEAMACGLPAIASEASIGPEVITANCGFVTPPGDLDRLVQLLRWFDRHRDELPAMSRSARAQTERYTWSNYRSQVIRAVSKLV